MGQVPTTAHKRHSASGCVPKHVPNYAILTRSNLI